MFLFKGKNEYNFKSLFKIVLFKEFLKSFKMNYGLGKKRFSKDFKDKRKRHFCLSLENSFVLFSLTLTQIKYSFKWMSSFVYELSWTNDHWRTLSASQRASAGRRKLFMLLLLPDELLLLLLLMLLFDAAADWDLKEEEEKEWN